MKNKTKNILFVNMVIACLLATGVLATMSRSVTIASSVTIKSVGCEVYSDIGLMVPLTNIAWGTLEPGQDSSKSCYIKSISNVDVRLNMTLGNWNPANATNYLSLTWNVENNLLNPEGNVQATLTIHVASNVTGITPPYSYSFEITISAIG